MVIRLSAVAAIPPLTPRTIENCSGKSLSCPASRIRRQASRWPVS